MLIKSREAVTAVSHFPMKSGGLPRMGICQGINYSYQFIVVFIANSKLCSVFLQVGQQTAICHVELTMYGDSPMLIHTPSSSITLRWWNLDIFRLSTITLFTSLPYTSATCKNSISLSTLIYTTLVYRVKPSTALVHVDIVTGRGTGEDLADVFMSCRNENLDNSFHAYTAI